MLWYENTVQLLCFIQCKQISMQIISQSPQNSVFIVKIMCSVVMQRESFCRAGKNENI